MTRVGIDERDRGNYGNRLAPFSLSVQILVLRAPCPVTVTVTVTVTVAVTLNIAFISATRRNVGAPGQRTWVDPGGETAYHEGAREDNW